MSKSASTVPLNVLPGMRDWAEKTGAMTTTTIKHPVSGYAATPGMGPKGETCRTCIHAKQSFGGSRSFWKCDVIRFRWTHGPGTDIRLKSPACRYWEAKPKGVAS